VVGGDAGRLRQRLGLVGPIVCAIGAMHHDKGTPHLVEAMERLWHRGSDATLVLAGPSMDSFSAFMAGRSEATRERTRVLGYVSDEEKRDLLAAADVFAMPSRTDSFGIAFLEAWLNGCPVIAAAAGGVPDVVEHNLGGLIVPFGGIDELASAIQLLLTDRALAARLADHGARQTRAHHTWDDVYDRVRPWFSKSGKR
jgi:glycosyltransferase involved in cell wall biosynthesis